VSDAELFSSPMTLFLLCFDLFLNFFSFLCFFLLRLSFFLCSFFRFFFDLFSLSLPCSCLEEASFVDRVALEEQLSVVEMPCAKCSAFLFFSFRRAQYVSSLALHIIVVVIRCIRIYSSTFTFITVRSPVTR